MSKSKITFELCHGNNLEDRFTGAVQEALQRGNRLASRLGNVSLYAYNEHINMREPVGTFIGHMRLKNLYGDIFIIKGDYTGIVKAKLNGSIWETFSATCAFLINEAASTSARAQ